MLKILRNSFLYLAAAGVVLLFLIALNLTHFRWVEIERFRETTLAIYFCLAMFVILRKDKSSFITEWASRLQAVLNHPRFFPVMSTCLLALYLLAALTRHLSFHTFSHDFSMIDEALYNSYHGQFMYSPVLGRSFFSEHFSPILILLIPLHYIFRTPYLLVLLQPLALWSSVLVLRKILAQAETSLAVTNLICLLYLNNPVMISTLNYLFHMESFLPLILLTMFYYYRSGKTWQYYLAFLLALMVKEDVGLYLLGFSAYVILVDRKYIQGLGTALVCILWVILALKLIIPSFGGPEENYRYLSRWSHWGDSPANILLGYVSHPLELVKALFSEAPVRLFITLLLVPFFTRWGWLIFLVPWIINSTSSFPLQNGFSLYYGIPVFSLAVIAAVQGTTTPFFKTLTRSSRAAHYVAGLAVVLNLAYFTFPLIPRQRPEFLIELKSIPSGHKVQTMSCFYPVLGYARDKSVLLPEDKLTREFVIVRNESTIWPFTPQQVQELISTTLNSGKYENLSKVKGFYIFRRIQTPDRGGP